MVQVVISLVHQCAPPGLSDLPHLHHSIDVTGAAAALHRPVADLHQDVDGDVLFGGDAAPWDGSWNVRKRWIHEIWRKNAFQVFVPFSLLLC